MSRGKEYCGSDNKSCQDGYHSSEIQGWTSAALACAHTVTECAVETLTEFYKALFLCKKKDLLLQERWEKKYVKLSRHMGERCSQKY